MTEANQQHNDNQATGSQNRLMGLLERVRSGELKARLRYFLFRKGQEAKRSDSLFSRYRNRLKEDWAKWLGIAAGITGLLMLSSPDKFSFWQIPLVFILTLLAPAVFELPNTISALFGDTENQHLVGKVITMTQEIADGKGQTTLDDRQWQVSGPDCLAGSTVQIVTLDSKTLYVIETTETSQAGAALYGG